MSTKGLLYSNAPASYASVSIVSTALGFIMGVGAMLLNSSFPQLGAHIIAIGLFHSAEFWVTARYNRSTLTMGSFLLTNGAAYLIALVVSFLEVLVRWILDWGCPPPKFSSSVGLSCIALGQYLRTMSMIQAAESFNHLVQREKHPSHRLITDGLYAWVRHPSYSAYYIWACGSQLMLGNWVSLCLCIVVLFIFFRGRIKIEEKSLVSFFGESYVSYRRSTPSGIPFLE